MFMDFATENPNASRSRLLFVDDEPLVLQGLQRTLHGMRAEWDMTFVGGGEEALETLQRQAYDAIITEKYMQDLGKGGREPIWHELYNQHAEQAKVQSRKD